MEACPGAQSPFFQVSKTTRCASELVVTVNSLPSASIASHMPPTVAVIQSKPPYSTYAFSGYPAKEFSDGFLVYSPRCWPEPTQPGMPPPWAPGAPCPCRS